MRKTVYILSITISAAILLVSLIVLYSWLNGPSPIPLDDPQAQSIKDVLLESRKIETLLSCDPESDINFLTEVYKDTADYKQTPNHRVMIATYLGEKALDGAGYLTYKKAYHLWERSGDPYPRTAPTANATLEYLYTLVPTAKPVRDCLNPLPEPELSFRHIKLKEDVAIAEYRYYAYQVEAVLRRLDGRWFVVSSRNLSVSP